MPIFFIFILVAHFYLLKNTGYSSGNIFITYFLVFILHIFILVIGGLSRRTIQKTFNHLMTTELAHYLSTMLVLISSILIPLWLFEKILTFISNL